MIEKSLDLIYNKDYLVIVPEIDKLYIDALDYSIGNVISISDNIDDTIFITNFINQNNFKRIIFVDYRYAYEEIISSMKEEIEILCIFTKSLGALSDEKNLNMFNNIFKMFKDGIISKIGFLDKYLYEVYKSKEKDISFISLDISNEDSNSNEYDEISIGLLNSEDNPRHSYYNELSAIKLSNKYKVKLSNINKITRNFINLFDISYEKCKEENLFERNLINLYINFTESNPLVFIKSMDNGVPCLLGNTFLLDNNKYLKDLLTIKSDDDIDEIKDKISVISKNREKILKEYLKYRNTYTKESEQSIENFIGYKQKKNNKLPEELLLSIIVPVYNTEKFLDNCLTSIVNSIPNNSEIIIINDGSKDNSERIIKKYEKRYPKLIRYIKQENHGLGNVRNVGLKEAKGKYIASIDSDDTIDSSFFMEAIDYLKKDIDLVVYDWLTVTNDDFYETSALDYIFKDINKYKGLLYTSIMPSTCNKIIKKSLFDDLDIKYIEDRFEDLSVNPFILLKAKTIKYINKPYYEYYIRSDSIMRSSAGYSMIDVIRLFEERLNKYRDIVNVDIDEFRYYTYSWRIEEYIINQLYTIEEKELKKFIDYVDKNIKEIIIDVFKNENYLKVLDTLKEEDKEYINKRNKALKDSKLEEFIIDARNNNNYFKITPSIIYYGYKD